MRSLTNTVSLTLAIVGVTIAAIVPAAAVSTVPLPEPMTGIVFGAGLIGAALMWRRKK